MTNFNLMTYTSRDTGSSVRLALLCLSVCRFGSISWCARLAESLTLGGGRRRKPMHPLIGAGAVYATSAIITAAALSPLRRWHATGHTVPELSLPAARLAKHNICGSLNIKPHKFRRVYIAALALSRVVLFTGLLWRFTSLAPSAH